MDDAAATHSNAIEVAPAAIKIVPPPILKKSKVMPSALLIQSILLWLFELFCTVAMPILTYQMVVNGVYTGALLYLCFSLYFIYTFASTLLTSPATWYAVNLINQQKYRQAEKVLDSSIKSLKGLPVRKDWTYLTLQSNLALTYMASGQYHKAETLYTDIIEGIEKNPGQAKHPLAAVYFNNLALVYLHQEEFDGAEQFANKAMAIWSAARPNEQAGKAYPLASMLEVNLYKEDLAACERDADEALKLCTQEQQPPFIVPESRLGVYVQALLYKSIVCLRQGRKDEGIALANMIISGDEGKLFPHFGYSIPGLNYLAKEFIAMGDNDKAERFLEIAYEILKAHPFHGDGPILLTTYEALLLSTNRGDEVADLKNWVRPGRLMLQG